MCTMSRYRADYSSDTIHNSCIINLLAIIHSAVTLIILYSISHFALSISNDLSRKIKLNKGAGRVIKSLDLFPVKSVFQVLLLRMVLATRQSQLLHCDNVRIGRTVDTVVDEQTGFAAQRE